MKCDRCDGEGHRTLEGIGYGGVGTFRKQEDCQDCGGSGVVEPDMETAQQAISDFLRAVDRGYLGPMPRRNQSVMNEMRVLRCAAFHSGGWRPYEGSLAAVRRLVRRGLLKECGICAMPPHKTYVITDAGREAIAATNV